MQAIFPSYNIYFIYFVHTTYVSFIQHIFPSYKVYFLQYFLPSYKIYFLRKTCIFSSQNKHFFHTKYISSISSLRTRYISFIKQTVGNPSHEIHLMKHSTRTTNIEAGKKTKNFTHPHMLTYQTILRRD